MALALSFYMLDDEIHMQHAVCTGNYDTRGPPLIWAGKSGLVGSKSGVSKRVSPFGPCLGFLQAPELNLQNVRIFEFICSLFTYSTVRVSGTSSAAAACINFLLL